MGIVGRSLIGVALLAAAGATAVWVFRVQIAERVFQRGAEMNITRNVAEELGDGLHVFVCGAGTPMPDPLRGGPCLAVMAGGEFIVIDAGSGGARTLTRMGYPIGEVDAVFLTHLHSDHMDGLGELLLQVWVNGGRDSPLPVHGPPGVDELVNGFNAAYRIDSTYRTAHHGPAIANPEGRGGAPVTISMPAGPGGQAVVYESGGVTVTAYRVRHAPVEGAYGYRIDYEGRSISISGDTIYDPNLIAASRGADLLFHEALNRNMVTTLRTAAEGAGREGLVQIFDDILDYHATPEDAARSAQEADVSRLVYYHTIPPLPQRSLNELFMKDAEALFDGPMEVAEDGFIYTLPPDNDTIERTKAF